MLAFLLNPDSAAHLGSARRYLGLFEGKEETMRYKVWVQIEAQPKNGECYDIGEAVDICICNTQNQARKVVEELIDLCTDPETIARWKAFKIYPYERASK